MLAGDADANEGEGSEDRQSHQTEDTMLALAVTISDSLIT
jgi:hypothetical protein